MQRDWDPIVIYCINNEAIQGKIITKNKRRKWTCWRTWDTEKIKNKKNMYWFKVFIETCWYLGKDVGDPPIVHAWTITWGELY